MAKELVYDALLKKEVEIEVDNQEDPNLEQNLINAKKSQRNALLNSSDWTMVNDSKLSDEQTAEATTYRQSLRDLPDQEGFPDIDFPTKPDFI